jgi:protein-S-isoprenylcysteine O-methyltransferase Ste14
MLSNKWGWFLMELPALILMPLIALLGSSEKNEVSYFLIGIWVLHYANRTLIFPFKLKTKNKKMPLLIVLSAVFFNGVNGFLNGYFFGYMQPELLDPTSIHVVLGVLVFFTGMAVNRWADRSLIALREKQHGYQVPKGGLFEYISCPNHFGEIMEWFGFAIIAWNLPAFTFAIWTFCNLSPRSLNHHEWYKDKFDDYPKNRKAVVPYIL